MGSTPQFSPHFTRCPTCIPTGLHFTHNRYHKMNNLSTKVNEVFEGEEGRWTKVVKRQVNKSIESVSENTEEVHNNLCETRAEAEGQRDRNRRAKR